jgi:hypothetical protein
MRNYPLGIALALAIVSSFSPAASAQNKQLSAPEKTQDSGQTPDLTGVWMQDHPPATADQYWIYKFTADEPPMTAWGLAKYRCCPMAGRCLICRRSAVDPRFGFAREVCRRDRSGGVRKPQNNETERPTRKTDLWATQFISPSGVRATGFSVGFVSPIARRDDKISYYEYCHHSTATADTSCA